jgi:hypothetical protein
MILIENIRNLCLENAMRWTNHVVLRLIQRDIKTEDVCQALMNGEIIEQYPSDYPFPSCLVLGLTYDNRKLHVVCGVDESELWVITAYYPNPAEWSADLKKRK